MGGPIDRRSRLDTNCRRLRDPDHTSSSCSASASRPSATSRPASTTSCPGAHCRPGSPAWRSSPPTSARPRCSAWPPTARSTASRRVNYYWIGAIPAMVFLGLVMMPFYYGSKVRSVPEYLLLRFNKPSHMFNSSTFAVATILIAGVNLYALALVLKLLLGWPIIARHRRRGVHRRRLHHARRPLVGDLQRGAAVLRDPRGADPDHGRRPRQTSAAGTA